MSGDLEKELRKWLQEQGYPLELEVARYLTVAEARVQQSEHYEDPDTRRLREIDLVGSWHRVLSDPRVSLSTALTIECKLARKKPWILFTSQQAVISRGASVSWRQASTGARRFLGHVANNPGPSLPLFDVPDRVGFGITESFTSGHDVPFEAVTSATKAAQWYTTRFTSRYANRVLWYLGLPVVVVGGLLFECFLPDRSDEIELLPMTRATLIVRRPTAPTILPVTIVTLDGFASLLQDVRQTIDELFELLPEYVPLVWEEFDESERVDKSIDDDIATDDDQPG